MGYMHIDNLYKNQTILKFKECYALEKIHGTSAHIHFDKDLISLRFFAGGCKHDTFVSIFNQEELLKKCNEVFSGSVTIYGEAYGGKRQGMSATYGKDLKFVAFDVKIGDVWLDVPTAEKLCKDIGLEFVDYVKIPTDITLIDAERDKDSTQAIRNGMGTGKKREGVILKPIVDVTLNNGGRVISKHKRAEFMETKTAREVSQEDLKMIEDSKAIAAEWVTPMRLNHVLDKLNVELDIKNTGLVIKAMIEDIYREAAGEITEGKNAEKEISKLTAFLYKGLATKFIKDVRCV